MAQSSEQAPFTSGALSTHAKRIDALLKVVGFPLRALGLEKRILSVRHGECAIYSKLTITIL